MKAMQKSKNISCYEIFHCEQDYQVPDSKGVSQFPSFSNSESNRNQSFILEYFMCKFTHVHTWKFIYVLCNLSYSKI